MIAAKIMVIDALVEARLRQQTADCALAQRAAEQTASDATDHGPAPERGSTTGASCVWQLCTGKAPGLPSPL